MRRKIPLAALLVGRIHRLSLKRKFVLMLLLPLVGLLYFNGAMLLQKWRFTREMDRVEAMVSISGVVSDFVQQAQRERALSEVFVASRGRRFAGALTTQRGLTDRAAGPLRSLLTGRGEEYGAQSLQAAGQMAALLDRLATLRKAVDGLSTDAASVTGYFDRLDGGLLRFSRRLLKTTTDVTLAGQLVGYSDLMQAKEYAAAERGLLGRLFLLGRMAPAAREKVIRLATSQQLAFDAFKSDATADARGLFERTLRGDCVDATTRLRRGALHAVDGAPLTGSVERWLEQSGCRIDRLRHVEQQVAAGLSRGIARAKQKALTDFLATTSLSLLLALLSAWLIYIVAHGFSVQTRAITRVMNGLAQGDFERRAEVTSGDELGEVAHGTNEMAARLQATAAAEREQRERERAAAAHLHEQVERIRAFAAAVAGGELRRTVSLEGGDELAGLADNLNGMTAALTGIARGISGSADAILGTVDELQSAINAQSSGASQQAASVTETTTTLEQIRATSTQTRDKAQALGDAAERMRQEGDQGLVTVEQGIAGIRGIGEKVEAIAHTILALSERTQQVGEITRVVDSLARQSKMLALNAAIEATKAGEAGRGFAVVAGEVKELAEQSQQSTAQVQRILQEIQNAADRAVMVTEEGMKGVEAGLALGERTGQVVRSLGRVINETTVASQQIVAAVRQEVVGIEQIATAMQDIQTITGHFVGATGRTGEAVDRLSSIADGLASSVRSYRV